MHNIRKHKFSKQNVSWQSSITWNKKPIEQNLNSGKQSVAGATPSSGNSNIQKLAKEVGWNGSSFDISSKEETPRVQGGKTNLNLDWLSPVAGGISTISSSVKSMNDTNNPIGLSIRDGLSDALIQSGSPTAMAIGAITKGLNAIGDATGFHTDDIDKDAAKKAGISNGERILNNAMNIIPGMSTVAAIFSPDKAIDANNLTDYGQSIMSSYSGLEDDFNTAKSLSGKRTFLGIGQGNMNRYINKVNSQANVIDQLGRINSLAKQSDYGTNIAQQNLNRYSGTNYQVHSVGKNGMKIMSRKEIQEILAKQKLQNGGVIGTDTNLLPEGALHARLNHLEDLNPDLEDATKKGIPVLDAEGNQVAEIEKEELIFRIELTQKIEELMKDGSEEAMIEAGKLLASELIENTQDNTGQIKEEVEDDK